MCGHIPVLEEPKEGLGFGFGRQQPKECYCRSVVDEDEVAVVARLMGWTTKKSQCVLKKNNLHC